MLRIKNGERQTALSFTDAELALIGRALDTQQNEHDVGTDLSIAFDEVLSDLDIEYTEIEGL